VFPNLPLPSYRRRDRAQLKMREFYISILEKRRASPDEVRPPSLSFVVACERVAAERGC